jgi:hypothetical protein
MTIGQAIGRSVRCPRCGHAAAVEPAQTGRDPQDPSNWTWSPEGPRPRPPRWVLLRCTGPHCGAKVYEGTTAVEVVL